MLKKKQFIFWIVLILLTAVDQLVKHWARGALHQGEALPRPWPGVFEIELTFNQGIAFGFLQGKGIALTPIAVIISAGSIWYSLRHPDESTWNHVGFGLLAAGAVGNLIDRVVFNQVTDMFWFRKINFPVFNVADSCITVATIMLILGWWVEGMRRKPSTPETQPAQAQ